jgi:hypothetical protein
MNKHFALMAIIAMVGVVSCNKNPKPEPTPKPEPDPDPVTATITAGDVTVDEGATVSINATTNSTAAITYATADAAVATVNDKGEVTGVKAGNTKITLKVAAVDKKFTAAEKTINVTVNAVEVPPTPVASITIDGEFADWTELEDGTFTKFVNNPDSPWEGVEEIRCYATEEAVYYYMKFDEESLADAFAADTPSMHLRLCINTDGEYESGYKSYFLEGYDFIIEGCFVDGGAFVDFDGEFHQRYGDTGPAAESTKWHSLLGPENGLVMGKGAGVEYEIALDRAKFNDAANTSEFPLPMGDKFQTGIRYYWNGWDEFSNMPNCSVEEEAGNGWGFLMRVNTNK